MARANDEFNERFYTARQRLLSYLLKLGHAIDANTADLAQAVTVRFCDSLVDYLSTGHFQILERYRPSRDEIAAFEATTRQALAFSDQFDNGEPLNMTDFRLRLEELAFVLDTRMDVEDEIIQRERRRNHQSRLANPATQEPAIA
jgi:regulator of sigma D